MTTFQVTTEELASAFESLYTAVDIVLNGPDPTYTPAQLAAAEPFLADLDESANCYGLEFALPSGHRIVFADFDPDTGVWCADEVYPGSPAAMNVYAAWVVLDPAGTVICADDAPLEVSEEERILVRCLLEDIEIGTPFSPDSY